MSEIQNKPEKMSLKIKYSISKVNGKFDWNEITASIESGVDAALLKHDLPYREKAVKTVMSDARRSVRWLNRHNYYENLTNFYGKFAPHFYCEFTI